jgi:hypothetical protein
MIKVLRMKNRALRTEKAYLGWLRSFYRFVNVQTTMIYPHVAQKTRLGVKSPID